MILSHVGDLYQKKDAEWKGDVEILSCGWLETGTSLFLHEWASVAGKLPRPDWTDDYSNLGCWCGWYSRYQYKG